MESPFRNSTPSPPIGSPLWYYVMTPTNPKIFLKALLAPIYTYVEGARAKKNVIALFFKILTAAQKIWSKYGLYSDMGEFSKSLLVDLKKRTEYIEKL